MPRRRISSKRRSESRLAKISSERRHCKPSNGRARVRNPKTSRCRLVPVHERSLRRSSRRRRKSRHSKSSAYRRSVGRKRRSKRPCTAVDGHERVRSKKTGRCRFVSKVAASSRRRSRKLSRSNRRRRHSKSSSHRRSEARKYYRTAMAKKGFLVKSRVKARKD